MKAKLLAGLAAAALLSTAAIAADTLPPSSGMDSPSGSVGSGAAIDMKSGTEAEPVPTADPQTAASPSGSSQSASVGNVTAGTLMSALGNTDAEVKEFKQLSSLTASDVQVVSADELMRGQSDPTLKSAIEKNKSQSAQLQDAIKNNQVVKDALQKSNASASDVIAIDVNKDGDVTLFTRPKS